MACFKGRATAMPNSLETEDNQAAPRQASFDLIEFDMPVAHETNLCTVGQYKMQTAECRLGIKCRLQTGYKMQTDTKKYKLVKIILFPTTD